jgi:hypothetical protein
MFTHRIMPLGAVVLAALALASCQPEPTAAGPRALAGSVANTVAPASIASQVNEIVGTWVSNKSQADKTRATQALAALIVAASGANLTALQDALVDALEKALGDDKVDVRANAARQLTLYIRSLGTVTNAKEVGTLTAVVTRLTQSTDLEVKLRAQKLLTFLKPDVTLTGVDKTCPTQGKATVRFTLVGNAFRIVIKIDGAIRTTLRNQTDGFSFSQDYEELEKKQEHKITIEIQETENSVKVEIDPSVVCPAS